MIITYCGSEFLNFFLVCVPYVFKSVVIIKR